MKSIRRNYNEIINGESGVAGYAALARVVKGKGYSRKTIRKNLYLIDEDGFDKPTQTTLIDQLFELSQKDTYEGSNLAENRPDELLSGQDEVIVNY